MIDAHGDFLDFAKSPPTAALLFVFVMVEDSPLSFYLSHLVYLRVFCLFENQSLAFLQYSGGQATEGQGGFYGSGGARVISSSDVDSDGRQALLAMAADVEKISSVMDELYKLESELFDLKEDSVSSKAIELKASIKKLITSPDVTEALDRLEVQDEPVWGLSADEREMIILAKQKMNER